MLEEVLFLYELLVLSFSVKNSSAHCTRGRCESATLSLFDDVKKDTALVGHVFKTFAVPDAGQCFAHCTDDCWCLSYNYKSKGEKDNCELNDANSYLSSQDLTRKLGVNYHEPKREYFEVRKVCLFHDVSWFTNKSCISVWFTCKVKHRHFLASIEVKTLEV